MHGNSGNSDDDKLFEKIKGDAISSNWIDCPKTNSRAGGIDSRETARAREGYTAPFEYLRPT